LKRPAILIIDDDPEIRRSITGLLGDEGYGTLAAAGARDGIASLKTTDVAVVLLDIFMPDMNGLDALPLVKDAAPDAAVIMISGQGSIDIAVKATKMGAVDFIEKPFQPERLLLSIKNALEMDSLRTENLRLTRELGRRRVMVGESDRMKRLWDEIMLAAPSKGRVLIIGENGTGKELVAAAIHENSPRRGCPFVKVNCAAIPKDLIESELFGHEKGAFTGATARKEGKFELADGGSLLLDEIGDMSLDTQAKLLRVLEENEFERIGAKGSIEVDVRLISSTNKNLQEEIKKANFRDDLYFRISVIPIEVPPLRERKEDIPLLVGHFARIFSEEYNKPLMEFSQGALRVLMAYDWPGNVRELKNVIERIAIMTREATVKEPDLRPLLSQARVTAADRPLSNLVEDYERSLIMTELKRTDWNVSQAASRLGIDRANLHRKMRRYGIQREARDGVSDQG
jgi:two-component system nitrogen regulation response regulator NtrX